MVRTPDADDDVIQLLCGRLMELICEVETLKELVCDMSLGLTDDEMPPMLAALRAGIVETWGKL